MDWGVFVIWWVLVILGSLAARMAYYRWEAWLAWAAVAGLGWVVFWYTLGVTGGATLVVGASSLAGFLGPELWFVFRAWVRQLGHISVVWLAAAAVVATMLYYPDLLGPAATLLIMIFGLYIMIKGFRPRT